MGINRFSQAVNPPSLYKGTSDELDILAHQVPYERASNLVNSVNQAGQNIFGINAPGKDGEVLAQKSQEVQAAVQELAKFGLDKPEIQGRINNLISSMSNDPDVVNITRRVSFYNSEAEKKKQAEEKGRQYVSPGLRQAEKYYNSGVYLRDEQFNKQGFIAPDNKELDEIAKNTPEWQTIVTKDGYDVTQKGKAEGVLAQNYLTHFTNNPQWSALLNDQFEQALEGVDLDSLYQTGLDGIKQMFPYLPTEAQQQVFNEMEEAYQIQQNNPYAASAFKDKLRDDYFKNQAFMAAQAKTYVNTTDKKANEYTKIAIQHQNAKELAKEKEEIKSQYRNVAGNTKIDPVRRARLVAASTNLGVDIADPTQADGYISNEALDDLGVLKGQTAANKAEETKLKVGEKDYTKTEIAANINSGSISFIKDFINSYLPEGAEEIEVVGENINYDTNNFLGTPGSFDKTIKKADLLKLIEDSKIDAGI